MGLGAAFLAPPNSSGIFWNFPPGACLGSQGFPVWNEVSRTKELWRQLCLRRWSSCKASQMTLGTQTWKQYYLCRAELEFRMECGRPEKDFICKAIAGHEGGIDELAYVSDSGCRFDGQEKSVVCTVSSDSTVRAWDVQEGAEIWSSPVQPAALVNLVTFPRLQLVVTVDKLGLIKVWKAENGQESASFSLPAHSSALQACDRPEGPFLLVASAEGMLYALTVPHLRLLSRTGVFPGSPTSLLCSPDCQWVFASTQDSDLGPKVFCTRSLLAPVEEEPPVSTTLPIWRISRACWAPDETARLMVMHRNHDSGQLAITTYELEAKQSQEGVDVVVQQIASFLLPDTMTPPHLMKARDSQVILLVSGLELVLFTVQGLQLAAFRDHQKPITALWVDESRVLTASFDLSLRVYVWSKENPLPVLKSCYHLLGGSHRWARCRASSTSSLVNKAGPRGRAARSPRSDRGAEMRLLRPQPCRDAQRHPGGPGLDLQP
ncbi:F-box/WD repeat-containing protein 12-like isoform X1 [Neovison vison]|uniref:F-box/WD repeat-containing protein 12-like isoform X1 n=2 Tax=Neovison vison TaxID=452646 RepID=UPI001CF064C3|nr:F-box/WD repeat-containing protein 12-like isoform X1 [Neogale vison]